MGVGVGPVYLGYMFETSQVLPPRTSNEIVTQRVIVITGRFAAFLLTKHFVTTKLNNEKMVLAISVNSIVKINNEPGPSYRYIMATLY